MATALIAPPPLAGLVWSNAQAPRVALVRAALLRPTFERLLALAKDAPAGSDAGLAALSREWRHLRRECSEETRRAAPSTERILRHLAAGFGQARRLHRARYAQAPD